MHVCVRLFTAPLLLQRDVVLLPGQTKAQMTVPQSLAVASLAGCGNVLVTNPIWLAVTRMQTAGKADKTSTFTGELRSIVAEGGVPALWTVRTLQACFHFGTSSIAVLLACTADRR